nr:hypothetical protein HK105_006929 [Polyrhizophydium stewartii]
MMPAARLQLSTSQKNDLLSFLSSSAVPTVGNYVLGRTIGEGTFGKVKFGRHKLTGQEVAVKIVDKIHAPALIREIETWRQMRHPNIAQLYEVLCTESRIYMVMEYCSGGEVFDYIAKHGRLDDSGPECRRIFRQIVDAVAKCHEKNFVHRDLKLENILMTDDFTIKLIDFGFTRDYTPTRLLDTYCGSSAYAAPEIVSGVKYSGPEADVWSLGIILYTLLCGYLPFDDDNEAITHKKISELDYDLPDFLAEDSRDLIARFLKSNPSERITIGDALRHPWFTRFEPVVLPTSPASDEPLLSGSKQEMLLAAQLEALGFDVTAILESVHTNACDQASALWYLLLRRDRSALLAPSSAPGSSNPSAAAASPPSLPARPAGSGDAWDYGAKSGISGLSESISASSSGPNDALLSSGGAAFLAPSTSVSSVVPSASGAALSAAAAGQDLDSPRPSGANTPRDAGSASLSPPFVLSLNTDIERYFTHVRQKSSNSENPLLSLANPSSAAPSLSGTSSGSLAMAPSSIGVSPPAPGFAALGPPPNPPFAPLGSATARGRRGLMLEAMRAASASSSAAASASGSLTGRSSLAFMGTTKPAGIIEESEPEDSSFDM